MAWNVFLSAGVIEFNMCFLEHLAGGYHSARSGVRIGWFSVENAAFAQLIIFRSVILSFGCCRSISSLRAWKRSVVSQSDASKKEKKKVSDCLPALPKSIRSQASSD